MAFRDTLTYLRKGAQGLVFYSPTSKDTVPHQFEVQARKRPDQKFLLFEDRSYTYGQANALINQHAHAYKQLGLSKGDVVALLMENRPEFLWHVLALGKLGCVTALINTNLQAEPLAHALTVCEPKRIVVGSELYGRVQEVEDQLGAVGQQVDVDQDDQRPAAGIEAWQTRLENAPSDDPPETGTHTLDDLCWYIYTSGTTGLPKAAVLKHGRPYRVARMFGGLGFRVSPQHVLYNCLPLYHSNGLMVATASVITYGGTMALARRFSASRFWDDCRKHNAYSFIYIGELCRYLMNAPERQDDRDNPVVRVLGNGLRPDIWEPFQKRFGIENVVEFYGSTEGNVGSANFRNVVGSVGRLYLGGVLARWDENTEDFARDEQGFLIKAKPGEAGILLGRIRGGMKFDGYTDQKATEKKIVRDAFKRGDAWFNTGDMLKMDKRKNLYFVDRLGDTFRWKGENVSTFEVQEQISQWPSAAEVNVYGVKIDGTDGRAGMASVVLGNEDPFDAETFKAHVDSTLPGYARPLFVRVKRSLDTTGTMKLKKTDLVKEGFDPASIEDPLYFRHPDEDRYVEMSAQLYQDVIDGKLRL